MKQDLFEGIQKANKQYFINKCIYAEALGEGVRRVRMNPLSSQD